jgi:glutamate dehydrogenase
VTGVSGSSGTLRRFCMSEMVTAAIRLASGRDASEVQRQMERVLGEAFGTDQVIATAHVKPREGHGPTVADLERIEALDADQDLDLYLSRLPGGTMGDWRLKLFRNGRISLSAVLPKLTNLGVEVIDEYPYAVTRGDGTSAWIYDLGLRLGSDAQSYRDLEVRFEHAFRAVWNGAAESDEFNQLVVTAGLSWREVSVLRAYGSYMHQVGTTFSQEYVANCLLANPEVVHTLLQLFATRFDPDLTISSKERETAASRLVAQLDGALDQVSSLDQDRILRFFRSLIEATLRTNYYQQDRNGVAKPYLAFKLSPRTIPGLPRPVPYAEVFVSSPRTEGVHLRFGPVARGGLRWSDRRDDFRSEVLGLAKAQAVKNAVIVPVGAKGGFVVRQPPPPPADGAAVLAAGVACYREFISGLLDVADNLIGGRILVPPEVIRRDGDDPYLVVAADKGTASFSDVANAVAEDYGFWLGDAFASGGSAGYDHKAMGITARGAWESVKHHFREIGRDIQAEDFTVIGIGDMSGDVFGNGMLLSQHILLVAAFDHRHIFLDPDPNPAVTWAERRRLFSLPRSTWADYDPSAISLGGGVYSRAAKAVPLSAEVKARLNIDEEIASLTPAQLIRAILKAPVDLLWNGGIGTYVKASSETNAEVGDKGNDEVRVDGCELRAQVVGEGGNLGFTQRGRIEYALRGGRINTDAIDNSAGVDTSDHEVNIKIVLDQIVRDQELTRFERDEFLAAMTDEVADLVLLDNIEQNRALGIACVRAPTMLPAHRRLIQHLERRGELDRELEFLPTDRILDERAEEGRGLTSPELCVLLAYVKNGLSAHLLEIDLPEQPWFTRMLQQYFPSDLVRRYGERLQRHPLRKEIVVTSIVNEMVNRSGITFAFRAAELTGASAADVTAAYIVAREVFDHPSYWQAVQLLPATVPPTARTALHVEGRRLLDRAARWLLRSHRAGVDIAGDIERYGPCVQQLTPSLPSLIRGVERERLFARATALTGLGAPSDIALRAAALLDAFSFLDIADIAEERTELARAVAELYFTLSERFGIDNLLTRITELPQADRWQDAARSALRDDLYSALADLTRTVLAEGSEGASRDPALLIDAWAKDNVEAVARLEATLADLAETSAWDIGALSVALRVLRTLVHH